MSISTTPCYSQHETLRQGLYYPPQSLKTKLCLRGRDLMYERCRTYNVPHKQVGKLVVAKESQRDYIYKLHAKSLKLGNKEDGSPFLPTVLLSNDAVRQMEPDLSKHVIAALWCPMTGIIDSHSFMESLEKDIIDSENGELVYSTRVVRVDPSARSLVAATPDLVNPEDGWVVQVVTGDAEEGDALLARTVINSSGLSSSLILNALLPYDCQIPMYYARGSYASYHGPGIGSVKRLIYPCPDTGSNVHGFQSLGTHLTLDLRGKVRFGPDIEWIEPPPDPIHDRPEDEADFWMKLLIPDESRLPEMYGAVVNYLPNIELAGLQPDYCGVRPKLVPPGGGFQDFVFRSDFPTGTGKGRNPMLSLLNVESPGLTSSLAIAEHVVENILHRNLDHERR